MIDTDAFLMRLTERQRRPTSSPVIEISLAVLLIAAIGVAAFLLILPVRAAHGMQFREEWQPAAQAQPAPNHLMLHFDGEIVPGDADKMVRFLYGVIERYGAGRLHGVKTIVSLNSPGGSVLEARKIAELFFGSRHQAVAVQSGHECLSACFLLFAAGNPRIIGRSDAIIGVHSASERQQETIVSTYATVVMSRDLDRYGVPAGILGKVVTTVPQQMYQLNAVDLQAMKVFVDPGINPR